MSRSYHNIWKPVGLEKTSRVKIRTWLNHDWFSRGSIKTWPGIIDQWAVSWNCHRDSLGTIQKLVKHVFIFDYEIELFLAHQIETSSLKCIHSFIHNMYVCILWCDSYDHLKHVVQLPITHCPLMIECWVSIVRGIMWERGWSYKLAFKKIF